MMVTESQHIKLITPREMDPHRSPFRNLLLRTGDGSAPSRVREAFSASDPVTQAQNAAWNATREVKP